MNCVYFKIYFFILTYFCYQHIFGKVSAFHTGIKSGKIPDQLYPTFWRLEVPPDELFQLSRELGPYPQILWGRYP